MFNSASTTNTFDAGKSGFVQGGPKKEKMGKPKGNMPGNNQVQNKQVDDVSNALGGLSKKQKQQLHHAIHGQGYGYKEVLQVAKDMFNK